MRPVHTDKCRPHRVYADFSTLDSVATGAFGGDGLRLRTDKDFTKLANVSGARVGGQVPPESSEIDLELGRPLASEDARQWHQFPNSEK